MILKGKAKEDFKKWFIETKDLYDSYENELRLMSDTGLNALIIEFFDSVGIYINVFYKYIWRVEIRDSQSSLLSTLDYAVFDTRQEATIQAIKKANEIYNNTDKV